MKYKMTNEDSNDEKFSLFPYYRRSKRNSMMKTDIIEKGNSYQIFIDLPGFEKENIKIKTEDNYVEVFASRIINEEKYIHQERFFGECYRKIYVVDGDKNNINASYKQGLLVLIIPKIEIKTVNL